jgi:carbamoyl-phosphate synthase large subunit
LEMYGCTLLTNNVTEVELYNDKWLAYKYYISNSIPSPRCYLLQGLKNIRSNVIQSCFPLIIKPRSGGGSRSIYKIETFDEIRKYTEIVPNPILSEYLLPDDEEYTAGTYRTTQNIVYVIIIKRKLKFGMTNSGHVVTDSVLEEFCRDIILKTKLRGANNIQFRLTSEGPKVLEINPRFSGTTGIRANYGFNEIEMWINESIGCTLEQPILKKGSFMRYMEEQYQFVDK